MTLATSLAAALARSPRSLRIALVALTLCSLAAPALALQPVYIWRDQLGAVRFSPAPEPVSARATVAAPAPAPLRTAEDTLAQGANPAAPSLSPPQK